MKGARLDTPLRVFWDVNYSNDYGGATLSREDVLKVADEIIACRPFYVNLGEDILTYPHLDELLEKFKDLRLKLTLSSSALSVSDDTVELIKEYKIDFLELRLDPHVDAIIESKGHLDKIREALDRYAKISEKLCPSLIVTKENYTLIPVLIDLFITHGIKYFKMPNTVINEQTVNDVREKHLKHEDIVRLRELLTDKVEDYKSKIELFIHDLFIFEIFYPNKEESGKRAEYGGCQAGNALSYIDQKGDLCLCSSLYVNMGSVLEKSIRAIFKSERRLKYRHMIEERYDDRCLDCADFDKCKGGCRGIVYFMNDSFKDVDPLCPYYKGGAQ